jgi:hypothetical protein
MQEMLRLKNFKYSTMLKIKRFSAKFFAKSLKNNEHQAQESKQR